MLKKIKKILGYYLLKEKIHFVNLEIAGFKLRGVKGTERKKPDQDDAWFFELAKHQ